MANNVLFVFCLVRPDECVFVLLSESAVMLCLSDSVLQIKQSPGAFLELLVIQGLWLFRCYSSLSPSLINSIDLMDTSPGSIDSKHPELTSIIYRPSSLIFHQSLIKSSGSNLVYNRSRYIETVPPCNANSLRISVQTFLHEDCTAAYNVINRGLVSFCVSCIFFRKE